MPAKRPFFAALFLALAAGRLCHLRILWTEEGLPLAAAVQMLHGKLLYRDVWFDKPPLVTVAYLLWGAHTGWLLRVAGALFALLACWLAYRFAREMWSEREGFVAAGLLGFFLTFGIPAALIPLAADSWMLVPHIAAVYLAFRGRPFCSGVLAGIAFLFNAKALFVLAACAVFQLRALPWLALGFALPNAAALAFFAATGALHDCYEQVFWLGSVYAKNTFVKQPVLEAIRRTLSWCGFHAALLLGAGWFWMRGAKPLRWKLGVWAALSLAATAAGWRFFPRYYLQLLPVMVLAGARGISMLWEQAAASRGATASARPGLARALLVLSALALAVPLVRFGPRYLLLARDLVTGREPRWSDVALDQDSRAAAREITVRARSGDTLFVWGYRPDICADTRMPAASRFLESQPLSGVLADRHLFESAAIEPAWTARNRRELSRSRPTFLVDGIGPLNLDLGIQKYPDLASWLAAYEPVARTRWCVVYRIRPNGVQKPPN